MNIPPKLLDWIFAGGKLGFCAAVFILAFNHWEIFTIENSMHTDALWFYVLINTFGVATIVYRRYKFKPSGKYCPKCSGELQIVTEFKCPNCGEVEFKK